MFANNNVYLKDEFLKLKSNNEKFSHIEFNDCSFTDCNFLESEFNKCYFINCIFTNCDLSVVKVTNTQFSDVDFKYSKTLGIDWTKAGGMNSSIPISISFYNSVLTYLSFFGLKLNGIHIEDCVAHEVDFTEANLTNAVCKGTDFLDSKFLHTNLTNADFISARNYTINPISTIIKKAKFSLPEVVSLLRAFDIVIE